MKRAIAVTAACHAVFFASAVVFPADAMNEVLRGALVVCCGLGIMRWGIGAWAAFTSSGKRSSMAILAIVTLLTGLVCSSVYNVLFIRLGRPDAWTAMYWSPYFVALTFVGVSLLVASTRLHGEAPTKLDAPLAAIVAFLGLMTTTVGPWAITKAGLLWHAIMGLLPRI